MNASACGATIALPAVHGPAYGCGLMRLEKWIDGARVDLDAALRRRHHLRAQELLIGVQNSSST